jgi:hypothetical protein
MHQYRDDDADRVDHWAWAIALALGLALGVFMVLVSAMHGHQPPI